MKKTRLLIFILIISLLIAALPMTGLAASVSVSASSRTVDVGDTVNVTVTFKGSNIGTVQASFSYDSSVLQYVSGSGTSNGSIVLVASGSGQSSLSTTIQFKAKAAGNSSVSVSASTVLSWDEADLGSGSGSTSIKVQSNTPAPTKKPEATQKPDSEPTRRPSSTTRPDNSGDDDNDRDEEPTRTPAPTATMTPVPTVTPSNITATVGDNTMLVVSDISGIGIPEGAERSEIEYNGETIDIAVKFGMELVYLTDTTGQNGRFYRYADGVFSPYIEIDQSESYIVLPLPDGEEVPEGFSAAQLTVNNSSVQGWANAAGQYLIYAVDSQNNRGFYLYDYSENSLQRYVAGTSAAPSAAPSASPTAAASPSPTPSPAAEAAAASVSEPPSSFMDRLQADMGFAALVGGLALLCLILLIVFIVSAAKRRKRVDESNGFTLEDDSAFRASQDDAASTESPAPQSDEEEPYVEDAPEAGEPAPDASLPPLAEEEKPLSARQQRKMGKHGR